MKDQGARDRVDEVSGLLDKLAGKLGYYRGLIGCPAEWTQGMPKKEAHALEAVQRAQEQLNYTQKDLRKGLESLQDGLATLVDFLGLERNHDKWKHKDKE